MRTFTPAINEISHRTEKDEKERDSPMADSLGSQQDSIV